MKILLINQFYYPDPVATAQLMTDLAIDLASRGHEVSVLTSRATYLSGQTKLSPFQKHKGVSIFRTFSTNFGKARTLGRVIDYLSFFVSVFPRALFFKKQDAVIVLSSPPLISLVGICLKYLRGSRCVYWVQDLYPEVAINLGFLSSKGLATRISFFLSKRVLKKSDQLITISDQMKEVIQSKGIDSSKISVIHNWSDGREVYPVQKEDNPFVKEHDLSDRFVVLYSGNFGHPHPMRPILEAAKELSWNKRFLFLFIGNGVRKQEIEDYVQKESLTNVKILPFQPREMLKYSLSSADVHIVSLSEEMEGLLVPCKIYGVLASGRPVILVGSPKGEIGGMIKNVKGGYIVSENDSPQLVKYLALIEHLPETGSKLGENNRKAFDKLYDRPLAYQKFESLLMTNV